MSTREHLESSRDYYAESARDNKISARLSTVMAVGFGVMSGCGVSLIIDGQPIGLLVAGAGGYLSWSCTKLSQEETVQAAEDSRKQAEYDRLLSESVEFTEDLE